MSSHEEGEWQTATKKKSTSTSTSTRRRKYPTIGKKAHNNYSSVPHNNRSDAFSSASVWTKPVETNSSKNGNENHHEETNSIPHYKVQSVNDFENRMHKSAMVKLMEEYGEYEPLEPEHVFQRRVQQQQSNSNTDTSNASSTDNKTCSALHVNDGRAWIHVDLVSFGFKYGSPSSCNNTGSMPLPPLDCRNLERASHHVARLSGLSHHVKRELGKDSKLREMVNKFAKDILECIHEAIHESGYGPALPWKAQFFIGSEYGRHRSVVLCELAAQKLRDMLRRNEVSSSNKQIDVVQIGGGVSVGTEHRDVDHDHKDEEAFGKDLRRIANYMEKQNKRNNDKDDDW